MVTFAGVVFAVLVTWGVNPIYSILTLITSALTMGVYLLQGGLEFIPFLIVLIYVGAVAVLFLFVVMMVNFKTTPTLFYLPECFFFWLVTALNLIQAVPNQVVAHPRGDFTPLAGGNFTTLGSSLYTTPSAVVVGLVGLILFVAMVGAISLTYISGETYRSQNIPTQTRRGSSLYRLDKSF